MAFSFSVSNDNLLWPMCGTRLTQSLRNKTKKEKLKGTTGLSEKMDGIWNRYNLKSTGRIYTFAS